MIEREAFRPLPDGEEHDALTDRVIGLAIEVHRELGPGLLESAYEECLGWELEQAGLAHRRQVPLPVKYKSIQLDLGYRLDIVIDNRLIMELKAVEKIQPVHEAQLLTYLRMTSIPVGLILNFNVAVLRHGIKRMSLTRYRCS